MKSSRGREMMLSLYNYFLLETGLRCSVYSLDTAMSHHCNHCRDGCSDSFTVLFTACNYSSGRANLSNL